MRLLAARRLGLEEVPVIRFEHLSEAQKRACILADNQIALQAGWDDALLGEELAWLRDERFDLDLIRSCSPSADRRRSSGARSSWSRRRRLEACPGSSANRKERPAALLRALPALR
jgi:hypothetical protein